MVGYTGDIQTLVQGNTDFRHVLFTGPHCQLVLMTLAPSEEIGMEVHASVDQFFHIVAGAAKIVMNGEETVLAPGMVAIVPSGVNHNVVNTNATEQLKLYTIYSPANHPDGTIRHTKAEAEAAEVAAGQS